MKPELYDEVALTRDLPAEKLTQGDVAVLIDYVPHPTGGEEGAVLEIFNAIGESIAVVTVPGSAIAPLRAPPCRSGTGCACATGCRIS
jgi:hypothetical protein